MLTIQCRKKRRSPCILNTCPGPSDISSPSIQSRISYPCLSNPQPKAVINPSGPQSPGRTSRPATRATIFSVLHGNMSVGGKTATTEGHDVGSSRIILDTRSDSSFRVSETELSFPPVATSIPEERALMARAATTVRQRPGVFASPPAPCDMVDEPGPFASPPSPYDGHHESRTPSTSLQARSTVPQYPAQRPRTLNRRSTRPFQRSSLPKDGTRQGTALQPGGEEGTEPNAAWKRQVREDRLALNSLFEANQEREANAVPNEGDNEGDLSGFNSRYQEYLGRRGLSTINEFTRHMERLFEL